MGMEIDSLEIAIQAQAKAAASEIDGLYQKLGNVATTLNRTSTAYRSAAKEAGRLAAAFKAVAAIRIPDFGSLITQLTALSKINLNNLTKKVDIDIAVNAPKSASQIQWALEKATDDAKVDSDKIAKQLIDTYKLTGQAKTAMKEAVNAMTAEFASGFDGDRFKNAADVIENSFGAIADIIRKDGSVISQQVGDEERILEAFAGTTSFVTDRVAEGMDKIRSKISDIKDARVADAAEGLIQGSVLDSIDKSMTGIRDGFENAMKIASHELNLDVEVNQDKIVRDIRNAIYKASKAEYAPVEVNLKVNKQSITDSVSKELQSVNAGKLPAISEAYERLFQSLMNVHTALNNSNSINNVVNALTRLTSVDLKKFDAERFAEITNTVSSLSSMGDVASPIAKMVSALVRLANAGDVMNTAAQALPELGNRLREAFDNISGANIDATTERVLNAFARLATSGEKAATAATNLPAVTATVRDFFDQMAQAPDISDTTIRMVEAFTALATTGRRIGSVGGQVSKSLSAVNDTGERTAKTFQNVSTHSNKVLEAFKKLISACGNLVKGIGSGASKIVSGFKSIGSGSNHIQKATLSLKNLLQVALGFYGIRTLFNWGKDAVEFASDLTEVQNVVENSFGTEGTKAIEGYAATARQTLGMSELTFKQIASRYQAMGNAMGITTGQIAKANANLTGKMTDGYAQVGDGMGNMSARLTMLAADMASFYNVEQSTVAEALNAVYTGQTRPLRQYGLDLTQATLQEWANKQGIDAKIASMSQAEKTMLRYQYVMAQTNTIQGDFARTSQTWANQVRLLKQNFQALGGVIGGTLINAFKPLISWLNKAMGAVISFAETIGNALGKIFGWKILHTPASNAADAYDTLSEGLDNAGTSGNDAADGIGNATKAAEEYKNTVLGFDELNKLNDPTKSSGNSGGGAGGSGSGSGGTAGVGDGTGADFQMVKTKSWLEDYKSDINTLFELGSYISNTLTKAMESIQWNKIYEKARNFGTGLASFLNGLIKPELFSALGGTIAGAINTVLNAGDAFLDRFNFDNLGRSLAAGINRFFKDFDFGLAASVFYKSINGLADTIIAAGQDIEWGNIGTRVSTFVRMALGGIEWEKKVYVAADTFGTGLATFLNGTINEKTFSEVGSAIAKALNTALHFLNNFGETFDFEEFGDSIAAAINRFFLDWDADLTADTFNKLALGALKSIGNAIGGVNWMQVGAKIAGMLSNIEWDALLQQFGTVVMTAINGALDFAAGLFDGTPISNAITGLKTTINDIAGEIDFESLKSGLDGIFKIGSQFVAGFMEGFTGAMGALADIGVGVLSGIGVALNLIAMGLNAIDPEWAEHLGIALGIVGAALVTIKGAEKAAGVITGIKTALFGTGEAATAAATAATTTSTAVASVGATASGTSMTLGGLVKSVMTSSGALMGSLFAGAVKAGESLQIAGEKTQGYNGKLTEMGGVIESLANSEYFLSISGELTTLNNDLENSNATVDEAAKAFADFFAGKGVDPKVLQTALGSVAGSMNLTGEQTQLLDLIMQNFNTTTSTTTGQVDGWTTSIKDADKAAKNVTGIGDVADEFDSTGKKAASADEKTGLLWSGIGTFAAGALGQSLLMAVLGGAFTTMGTKAEDAQTPIDNLKTGVTNFVKKIGTEATTAKTNSETLGTNVVQGAINSMKNQEQGWLNVLNKTMVTDPQLEIVKGWDEHSPSKVSYGYGENIIYGLQNALTEKGNLLVSEISAIVTNMQAQITGKFGAFKQAGTNLAQNFKTGFASVRFNDLTNAIWKSISFTTLNSNMKTAGQNAMNKFASGMYSTYVKTPHLNFTTSVYGTGTNRTMSWNSSLSWYENGGFPNVGDLFVANEKKPELVGHIGNRPAVVNEGQIIEAVSTGVARAVSVVLSNNNNNGGGNTPVIEVTVKADSETLYRAVKKGEKKASGRYGTAVAIG